MCGQSEICHVLKRMRSRQVWIKQFSIEMAYHWRELSTTYVSTRIWWLNLLKHYEWFQFLTRPICDDRRNDYSVSVWELITLVSIKTCNNFQKIIQSYAESNPIYLYLYTIWYASCRTLQKTYCSASGNTNATFYIDKYTYLSITDTIYFIVFVYI